MTESGEMGAEARAVLQDMMLLPQKSTIDRKESIKRKRENISELLLKAQGIPFGRKCTRCELNCAVKHAESMSFWAKVEGLEPEYCLDQRDEAVNKLMKETGINRDDAGKTIDSELEYCEETIHESRDDILLMMTGLKNCPKQGHLEKVKIKKKRRTK